MSNKPRMTAKYKTARDTAYFRNIPPEGSQEELYERLQAAGFFWNSDSKVWEEFDIEDADDPTRLVMIRVWADAEIVEEAADDLVSKTKKFFELIERSKPYPCRPPKQREARVYLKFLPKRAG